MKKCEKCRREFDYNIQFCEECGIELIAVETSVSEENNGLENDVVVSEKIFCIYCGEEIEQNKSYCSKCGNSTLEEGKKHCIKCGSVLTDKQKFCGKCGYKSTTIIVPRSVDQVTEKIKKVSAKKIVIAMLLIVGIIGLGTIGFKMVSKMLVSYEEYLEQGNYEEAYKKADKENKDEVLLENLIANICSEAKDGLKNPDSFKLKGIWYKESSGEIVLDIQGTNSYGGTISSYWYYTFDKKEQEYQLYVSVSDFDEEEVYSWDDAYERLEKILENSAKSTMKKIVNDKNNKIDDVVVKRINKLNDKEMLDDVELLDDINLIYPIDENV